ncbi:hypothetical protein NDU88_005348 [Pleurodeles waltl]|uniref:Fork-head domain-containing protein n=1 Tax=Pleurodeles waltl TaxID=8319 RepID=A0AAV7L0Z1_PLEWA|nr:hypothetical protein NDU88_005348 [Pleurodeles waltl]
MPVGGRLPGASFLIENLLFGDGKREHRATPAANGPVHEGATALGGTSTELQGSEMGERKESRSFKVEEELCVHQLQGARHECPRPLHLEWERPDHPYQRSDAPQKIQEPIRDHLQTPHHSGLEEHPRPVQESPQRSEKPQDQQHCATQPCHQRIVPKSHAGPGPLFTVPRLRTGPLPQESEGESGDDSGSPHEMDPEDESSTILEMEEAVEGQEQSPGRASHGTANKPGQSYIALISMAILSSPEKKLLLSDIYQWIMDSYPYFKNKEKSWRNSVRHNLSLNECFIKAGRSDNGKGHYWAIHPANLHDFSKGEYHRRRARRRIRRLTTTLNYFHPYALYGLACCTGRFCLRCPPPYTPRVLGSSQVCQPGCPLPPSGASIQPHKYPEKQLTWGWNRSQPFIPLTPY